MRTILTAMLVLLLARSAEAVVLCAKPKSDGTYNTNVKLREVCKTGETQLDSTALGLQGPQGEQGPAGSPGTDGKDGTQGPTGPPGQFLLLDGQNNVLGPLLRVEYSNYTFMVPTLNKLLTVTSTLVGDANVVLFTLDQGTVFYSGPNCTGQAYVRSFGGEGDENSLRFLNATSGSASMGRFFAPDAFVPAPTPVQSQAIGGGGNDCYVAVTSLSGPGWMTANEVTMPFPVPIARPLQIVSGP